MTAPTLPSNVGYGQVVGRFLLAVADGADADTAPDAAIPTGLTVTFVPAPGWMINATALPDPVRIVAESVTCDVDAQGYLRYVPPGTDPQLVIDNPADYRGVTLIATDDTDLNPSGWTWQVTIRSPTIAPQSFPISVPQGGVVDLAKVSPISSSTGNAVIVGPAGPPGPPMTVKGTVADSTALPSTDNTNGDAYITSDTGHVWVWADSTSTWTDAGQFQGPPGPQGDQGIQGIQGIQGPQGDPGVAGANGSDGTGVASANVDGAGNLTLTLTDTTVEGPWNVKGPKGDTGAAGTGGPIHGTGFPEGVVTAVPGTEYIDDAITNGAAKWMKMSGTGNTGWRVTYGDTGWRNINSLLVNGYVSGGLFYRRDPFTHTLHGVSLKVSASNVDSLSSVQDLTQDNNNHFWALASVAATVKTNIAVGMWDGQFWLNDFTNNYDFTLIIPSRSGWPSTLPGIPGTP